jgi:hypothetical protein
MSLVNSNPDGTPAYIQDAQKEWKKIVQKGAFKWDQKFWYEIFSLVYK